MEISKEQTHAIAAPISAEDQAIFKAARLDQQRNLELLDEQMECELERIRSGNTSNTINVLKNEVAVLKTAFLHYIMKSHAIERVAPSQSDLIEDYGWMALMCLERARRAYQLLANLSKLVVEQSQDLPVTDTPQTP